MVDVSTVLLGVGLGFLNLFLAGLLAGEELAICVGVRKAISTLEASAHLRFHQAMILRLRVLVPAILVPTILTLGAVLAVEGPRRGFVLRSVAVGALLAFALVTFLGTVPINQAVLGWDPDAPPGNWRAQIARWERLDVVRCVAAVVAFASLTVAVAQSPLGG